MVCLQLVTRHGSGVMGSGTIEAVSYDIRVFGRAWVDARWGWGGLWAGQKSKGLQYQERITYVEGEHS